MRITNNMMMKDYLGNLNNNLASLTEYQRQITSGKAINSLSDDPIGLISIMNCKVKLSRNDQYQSTVESAMTWLRQTDTSVYELNQIVQSAYEKVVEVSNDSYTGENKTSVAEYILQLRDHVLTIANGQATDKYIFGGYNVNKTPFTIDAGGNILYNGLDLTNATDPALIAMGDESIAYDIGPGITMDISIPGTELLGTGNDNVYTVLDELYNALISDAPAEDLNDFIPRLQGCQDFVMNTDAKVGGMLNRLELLQNRYGQEKIAYTEMKSNVEDVDYAEAYMYYSMAQSVYDGALQVSARILQSSILDYLR